MATTYNRRCGLCGQFVAIQDREALLTEERFEWDESLVDDFIAGNRHLCVDTDPHGARQWARLAEAGEMAIELRWLIEAALERQQAVGRPAWAVFTGPAGSATVARHWPAGGSLRPVLGRLWDQLPADCGSRSPP